MSREYDIMAAGHLCIDVIPRFPDTGAKEIGEILRPGTLVNIEEAIISTGGPVSNTGLNMKMLGKKVVFCARVGDDDFGRLTTDFLRREGSIEGINRVPGAASSYTIVISPPHIDRIFLHCPGTNSEFGPEDLDPDLIRQCRHFHFGYPPLMRRLYENTGEGLCEVFQIAKAAGATTSCDMTLPDPKSPSGQVNWLAVLEKILPHVDLFLPSIEETFFMIDPQACLKMKQAHNNADPIDFFTPEDYTRIADQVLSLGSKMVSLKSGHRGFYFKTAPRNAFEGMGDARPGDPDNWSDRELWAPAFQVPKLASATGSGDSAIAGLLSAFLRGLTIEASLKYATCLGWQNVQVLDAVSGIRNWDETTEILERNMPSIDARIAAEGWKFSERHGLWSGSGDPLSRGE